MITYSRIRLATFVLMSVLVSACGGGSDDSPTTAPPPPPPVSGISGNGVAIGPISTFGSIVVNGVRYDTTSASISIDGNPAVESDLDVGDVVIVKGTINDDGTTGTAETVLADDVVTGPVQSINLAASSMVVLGQNVSVTADTSFDDSISPASLEGLIIGDIVEVYGLVNAGGVIAATRIEDKPIDQQFQVHGIATNVDTTNMRFEINTLTVDYSAATLDDFPGGQIAEGDPVEAKGSSLGAGGELLATRVEFEANPIAGEDGLHAEIEGFITRFVSASDFDVTGFPVTTTAATVYIGGTAADLGLNVKVEVEGEFDAAGLLVADTVDIRRTNNVGITATIDSVDAPNNSFVLLGVVVNTDSLTRFEDGSDADLRPLTIADLNTGDYMEIRGDEIPAGSGELLASLAKRDDLDDKTEIRGFVSSIAQPDFVILGVTISTNGSTVFRDVNDGVISDTEFFSQLAVNSEVNVDGSETGDTQMVASEVEFE